jgi:hypothetical protein
MASTGTIAVTVWWAILATAAGYYLLKLLGLSVPARLLDRPAVRTFAVSRRSRSSPR